MISINLKKQYLTKSKTNTDCHVCQRPTSNKHVKWINQSWCSNTSNNHDGGNGDGDGDGDGDDCSGGKSRAIATDTDTAMDGNK